MGLMHGIQAKIYWDALDSDTNLVYGQNWSLNASQDVVDITSMQDTWRTYLGGFTDWTATVECLLNSTAADTIPFDPGGAIAGFQDATQIGIELYFVWDSITPSYKCLYGYCTCTGISPSIDKDGPATMTYTFQGIPDATWYLQWHSGIGAPIW